MSDEKLPILLVPDPRLRLKCRPVGEGDGDAVRALAPRMLATMYAAPGIGLAAPQVGSDLRLFVLDCGGKDTPEPMVLVNPEIIAESKERGLREEGCLSLPGLYADVERPQRIKIRWRELDGTRKEMEADGLLGVCMQHEMDHLNGVLFVDHLSALKRNMMLRKLAKELKNKARDAEGG
ncbi:peptide deformylase [Sediminicoccus rosea]|jgi:peptide deformylase|uniref:Peptide deformylase n=1 Tax=Sediminicoccus rosea TaxID=1225128 RepID=A0ABZ0PFD6_9PROT|nr:peptide deformylase [Sediminicoccus rosea]WPB84335.1 peptide deformylase [Sediminicoccus rosea]